MRFSDEERVHINYVARAYPAPLGQLEDFFDLHHLTTPVVTTGRAGAVQHLAAATVGALHHLGLFETAVIHTAPFARARLRMFSFWVSHSCIVVIG